MAIKSRRGGHCMSLLMANRALFSKPRAIPTVVVVGDSLGDGRGNVGTTSGSKYFPKYATDIINQDKTTVKIFDKESTNTWVTLNKTNAQVDHASYNFGSEQSLMWELAKHYGTQEIRIIKYGLSSTTAGTGTNAALSWQPGQLQMNNFTTIYNNAVATATAEGVTLDLIACVAFLGTNDAEQLILVTNYETNMTSVINHLRNNLFNKQVPMIITSCSDATTYKTEIRAAQQSLCANVSGCYYMNNHKYGVGLVHPTNAGIFAGGIEMANSIITNVLGASEIMSKYYFKFQTNRSGSYSINTYTNEGLVGYFIDWGDGNSTEITGNNQTSTHTYADASTKTITITSLAPFNLFRLDLNSAAASGLVGEFDCTYLTGLDVFTTSVSSTALTSVISPLYNYAYKTTMPTNLLYGSGVTTFDFSNFGGAPSVTNNASLTAFIDNSTGKSTNGTIDFNNNDAMGALDFGSLTRVANWYCRNNLLLPSITIPNTMPTAMGNYVWFTANPALTTIVNYQYMIYVRSFEINTNALTRAIVDNIINEMWDRARDTSFYATYTNKSVRVDGNNGVTGTFDGTTDWVSGLPTTPASKAYDLLNDVTGTYNFSTFIIV